MIEELSDFFITKQIGDIMAKIYVIGVGTGSKDCLTLRAVEILQKLDVLYCPTSKSDNESIAFSIAKDFLKSDVEVKNRHFPMIRDREKIKGIFKDMASEMKNDALSGKNVGFVTIGDPMIYSTFIYVLESLKNNIEVKTISGIPSFVDVASKMNFPIAFDDMPFVVIPSIANMEKIEKYIAEFEAIVLMKAYKNYSELIELIKKYKLENHTLIVSNSSRENEKIIFGKEIFSQENEEYLTTIIINKRWEL